MEGEIEVGLGVAELEVAERRRLLVQVEAEGLGFQDVSGFRFPARRDELRTSLAGCSPQVFSFRFIDRFKRSKGRNHFTTPLQWLHHPHRSDFSTHRNGFT